MTTRRRFLRDCSTLTILAGCGPAVALAGSLPSDAALPDRVSFRAFAASLGTAFWIRPANALPVALELVQARPQWPANAREAAAPDAGNERFSLLFQGSRDQPLPQDTYAFEHPRLGRFAMFIVPIGSTDPAHQYYEAIFNRPPVGPRLRRGAGRSPSEFWNGN